MSYWLHLQSKEGKTTVAFNTAVTLAGNSKVLLIGADIRNPQLQSFVAGSDKGLTDYLISDDTLFSLTLCPLDWVRISIFFSVERLHPIPMICWRWRNLTRWLRVLAYIPLYRNRLCTGNVGKRYTYLIEIADAILYIVKSIFTDQQMLDFTMNSSRHTTLKNTLLSLIM